MKSSPVLCKPPCPHPSDPISKNAIFKTEPGRFLPENSVSCSQPEGQSLMTLWLKETRITACITFNGLVGIKACFATVE